MKGKLIIIEGLDGSGKSTQIEQLANRAKQLGKAVRQIKFPNYAEDSSALVKAYLRGELGGLHEINAYAASVLYSVDRNSPEIVEAKRLLKFLDYFVGISGENVPANSLLREFIGGGCFQL